MIKIPISIKLVGDSKYLQEFIGPAKSQMELLRNFMSFRNLSQGVRRIRLQDNVYIECVKCYNHERCTIVSSEVEQEEIIDITKNVLLIVYGDQEDILNMYDVSGTFVAEESVSGSGASGTITAIDAVSGSEQTIYGDFINCDPGIFLTGSSSSAHGIVAECYERYFQRAYEYYEIREDSLPSLIIPMKEYEITSALDTTKPSKISCSDDKVILQEWSKTLNKLMISVFSYYKKSEYSVTFQNKQYWSASASYNGTEITIDGNVNFSEFVRTVNHNNLINWSGAVKTHIGFDLWQDSDSNYYASLFSDQEEILYIFKYDSATQDLILQNSYTSTIRNNYYLTQVSGDGLYSTEDTYRYIRLLGYGYDQDNDQHKAYWGDLTYVSDNDKYFGTPHVNYTTSLFYYEEHLNTSTSIKHLNTPNTNVEDLTVGVFLVSAYWHPIKKEISIIYTDGAFLSEYSVPDPVEDGEVSGYSIYDYGSFFVGNYEYSRGFQRTDYTYTYESGLLVNTVSIGTPIDAYYYELEKIGFNLDLGSSGISFEYRSNEIVAALHCGDFGTSAGTLIFTGVCDSYTVPEDCYLGDGITPCRRGSCYCNDYVWTYYEEGNLDYVTAASDEFPYDEGWTAILLSGIDYEGTNHSNWVIYKDLENDTGYFVVDSNGAIYPLSTYDRSFFLNFSSEE